jgi:hypothetical protein
MGYGGEVGERHREIEIVSDFVEVDGFTYLGIIRLGDVDVPVSTCDRCSAIIVGADYFPLDPLGLLRDMRQEHFDWHFNKIEVTALGDIEPQYVRTSRV